MFNNRLVLKFELYSVNEEAIFETFTDYNVNDFYGMLASLEARLPATFKKMVSVSDRALADDRNRARERQRQEAKARQEYKPAPAPEPPKTYAVATAANPPDGGTVSRSPSYTAYYASTRVTVTASPNAGYTFAGWSGGPRSASNNITITVKDNLTLTANFQRMPAPQPPPTVAAGRPKESTPYAAQQAKPRITLRVVGGASTSTSATVNKATDGNKTLTANFQQNDTPPSIGTFMDTRDGKTYKTVTIGSQVWMVENLNYDVPDVTSDACYNNNDANCEKYGRLYNWSTAMAGASSSSTNPSRVQGVCPPGWHIPSDAEWTVLENAVGGSSTAGTKLKSKSGWNSGGNGTNNYGWSALPGGYGISDGSFYDAGDFGRWWSATEYDANNAKRRNMGYSNGNVGWGYGYKTNLFSVRCVADQ
jgi:uncharacterized protein (TIGR02145 family)/uncharacterized repeat protein (TIGR02543 family)